jgi:hypothetical protein
MMQRQPLTNVLTDDQSFIDIDIADLNQRIYDFDIATQSEVDILRNTYNLNPNEITHQIRFATDIVNDADVTGSDNDRKGGVAIFGTVKANIENAANLVKIELNIRGDPYWMGMPNSFYYNYNEGIVNLANYEKGSLSFFLKANLPTSDEDAFGRRPPRADYIISGIYTVVSVINSFKNGMFVQYLSANRDLITNMASVIEIVDKDSDEDASVTDASFVDGQPTDAASLAEAARSTQNIG